MLHMGNENKILVSNHYEKEREKKSNNGLHEEILCVGGVNGGYCRLRRQ
jgi:hypothetical protein